jgi:hypothetical protein
MDNVEFRLGDARSWDEPGGYDLGVFAFPAIAPGRAGQPAGPRMWVAVVSGVVLIVEGADFGGRMIGEQNAGPASAYPDFLRHSA